MNRRLVAFAASWALSMGGVAIAQVANPPQGKVTRQEAQVTASGTVVDETGEPVIGASILEVGTQNGVTTDIDGKFTLKVHSGANIAISYIGMESQTLKAGANLNVVLKNQDTSLNEVVVTALGIKRSEKSLGYAMQQLNGDAIVDAHEVNIANALTGKVAGVQVIRSSNGPGGSSKIQLRGANSVTGTNQPLIVVDGVPMDNFTGADAQDGFFNVGTDYGNGLSDINPEDIESMSVLKGASAAALYGSRAGSGVILITTKKGAKHDGLGITISGSVSAETIFMKPEMQTSYGQGTNGIYSPTSTMSWGPRIEGQEYTKWDGSTGRMAAYDNVGNYFNTGVNATESVSLSQVYGKTSVYASFNRMDDFSKIPGTNLKRTNLTLRAATTFGKDDRWSFDGKVQFIQTGARNRPLTGSNESNRFRSIYIMPTSLDIRDFKAATDATTGDMIWWNQSGQNPYWMEDHDINTDKRDRFLMNASLKYQFTSWLNAEIRAGSDMYNTEYETKLYAGGHTFNGNSQYALEEQHFYENNFSFLISATKDELFGKWGGSATFGGNLMARKKTGLRNTTDALTVPDLFSLTNSPMAKLTVKQTYEEKKINSLYGTVGINYDTWAFLDATFRNDWTSTLSKNNRSFFYPSVNLALVVSDMLSRGFEVELPRWFTYAKVRASYAQVGNDMDPYHLYNVYSIGSDNLTSSPTANSDNTLYNADVKNELIKSWEVGAELRFFNNRLGLDFTWYKSNATNQLMTIPMNSLSGYTGKIINAGNIENTGIEIMLSATPVETSAFKWDMTLNYSQNRNRILELADGVTTYTLGSYDALRVYAVTGGNYGEIWGTKFQRVTEGEHAGELLLSSSGLPQATGGIEKIGDQQPDCMLGWTNNFTYKGWNLGFQIDGRFGGDIFSSTNQIMQAYGRAGVTENRDEIVVQGVVSDGKGGYVPNTAAVTAEQYWTAIAGGNTGINEANIYSATNIRLRNVSLSYTFPKKMLKKTIFQAIKLGVSVNNVWMIYSDMHGIDPESVFVTNTNATGLENCAAPTSRSYLFNVTLGF